MDNHTFGHWIKRLRAEQDLTQEKLAEIIGCAAPTLRAFETGKRRPSRAMAEHVAEVLNIPSEQRARFLALARQPVEPPAGIYHDEEPEASTASPRAPSTTLPRPSTVLIGRESERAALLRLLGEEGQRLVTLVGTGGMGKTRLAIEVAASLAAYFPDGVVFVSLASVDSAYNVPGAIIEMMDLPQHGTRDPQLLLYDALRPRRMLLVLDNFEHLLSGQEGGADATPIVRGILNHAPQTHLLVTSRERLRLSSERVFELSGLPVPDAATTPEQTDAGLLFLERARQVSSSFTLTPQNREAVTRICQLVDGMPLAIELAASWVRALSCEDIAAELARSIDFLALSDRDVPARHRNVRAVFDHSWRLLSPAEQAALAHLAIFHGGCTRPAAQAVAEASLPVLAGLIDKSLLRAIPADSDTRYDLHPLVRQYAAGRLQELGALDETAERHSQYYAGLLLEGVTIEQSGQVEWLKRLTAEADNIRAAWQWALRHQRIDLIRQMGRTLVGVYELNGWLHEAATLFESAYAALAAPPAPGAIVNEAERQLALGYIQGLCGFFLTRSGQYELARQRLLESQRLLQPHPRELADTPTFFVLGYLALLHGEYAEGRQWFELNQRVCTEAGEIFWRELGNDYYTRLLWAEGAREEARRLFAETLVWWRRIGNPSGLSSLLSPYGGFVLEDGDLEKAETLIREGVQHAFSGGHRSAMVMGQHFLGCWALAAGDPGEARRLQQESLELAREIGDLWAQCLALNELGKVELSEKRLEAAWAAYEEVLLIAEPRRLRVNALNARLGQAEVLLCQGKTGPAIPLLQQVVSSPHSEASARARAQALLAEHHHHAS